MTYFKILTGVFNKLRYVVLKNIFSFYIKRIWNGTAKINQPNILRILIFCFKYLFYVHRMTYFKILTGVFNKLRYVVLKNISSFYIKTDLEWSCQNKSTQYSKNFNFFALNTYFMCIK